MKKLFVSIAIMAIAISSFAQVSFFPVKKDVVKGTDTIKVSDSTLKVGIYAGILSGVKFTTDSLHSEGFSGIRFGGDISYSPAKWVTFNTWGIVQIDANCPTWSLQQFYVTLRPVKGLNVSAGYMATLVTEQRPYPVSGNGQFETWSESQIPGAAMNIKLKYQVSKDFQLATGIALRQELPEYSGRITYKGIQLSAWYAQWDKEMGSALTISSGRVYTALVYKQNDAISGITQKTIADICTVTINKKHSLSVYNDIGFCLEKDHPLARGEAGLLKGFSSPWINGLIGLGWDYKNKWIVGYLYIHL